MSDHFFVTLDSQNTTAEGNTTARFTTRFPAPMNLDADWEVALVSISYPKTWWTIPNEDYFITFGNRKHILPPGYYSDPWKVLEPLNWKLSKATLKARLSPLLYYDRGSNRLEGINASGLEFSDPLRGVLGLDTRRIEERSFRAHWEVDLQSAFHALYVYSDLVDESLVGDVSAPLLRAIEAKSHAPYGTLVNINYTTPYYLPLSRRTFTEAEVLIADTLGRPVQFRGKTGTLLTLHFRRDGSAPR